MAFLPFLTLVFQLSVFFMIIYVVEEKLCGWARRLGYWKTYATSPDRNEMRSFLHCVIQCPIWEEIFFRGPLLLFFTGPSVIAWLGIFVSSLLFHEAHYKRKGCEGRTRGRWVIGMSFAILLGSVTVYSQTLFYAMALHSLWNFTIIRIIANTGGFKEPDPLLEPAHET